MVKQRLQRLQSLADSPKEARRVLAARPSRRHDGALLRALSRLTCGRRFGRIRLLELRVEKRVIGVVAMFSRSSVIPLLISTEEDVFRA